MRQTFTPLAARALAPDLARGFMLLFIALANAHIYLYARDHTLRGYPAQGSLADQVVALAQMLLVDGRAYPLFSFLFGYGMVQLLRRHPDDGGGLLRRRGWWMIGFGAVHGVSLFSGDIIASYGLTAVLLVGFRNAWDQTLLRVAGVFLVLAMLIGLSYGTPQGTEGFEFASMAEPTFAGAVAQRAVEWTLFAFWGQVLVIVPAALLGIWAARRRVLHEPERHRAILVRTAVAGLGLAVVGGLPFALMSALFWTDPPTWVAMVAGALHTVTGYAGGLGWAALFGLAAVTLANRVSRNDHGFEAAPYFPTRVGLGKYGPVSRAIVASGQRSMTCYLLQSVVFVAVFAPYAGGLGARLGIAATSAIAAGVWLVTVLLAAAMRRVDHRGPAELALRNLTYR